ncbi:MAG: non-hydrolyzing UDP-N-acetylglucosamine 2-epimerase [Desulfomonilia bacterium]
MPAREGTPIILHIVGARPQFIKLAPVIRAFKELNLNYRILHTGQHYDYSMSDLHFSTLGLEDPHYHLGIGSDSHAKQTARMLEKIEATLIDLKPSLVMVYGDTNSTLAGSLSAVKLGIHVAHVEAGVRSFDRSMPEEINRVLTDRIADYHFCPTRTSVDLLKAEGISGIFTGDVMYDALRIYEKISTSHPFHKPFVLTTIHRAENTNNTEKFSAIWEALKRISADVPIIFPIHPRTRTMYPWVEKEKHPSITIIEPVSYLTMIAMIRDAYCMITDSGGVQKEAFLLKTPCVTVRDTTEWPETVSAGANRLAPTDPDALYEAFRTMASVSFSTSENPFGDGRASHHIAQFILQTLD